MADARTAVERIRARAGGVRDEYAHGHDRPLTAYLGIIAGFGALAAAVGGVARRRGSIPDGISGRDLALITVATARLSRTLARDPIASPLRAPFTRYRGEGSGPEVQEEVRSDGGSVQHAVGELVTCPFCTAEWVASAFVAGLLIAPRATRLFASTLVAKAGSDVLQHLYASIEG